MRIALFLMLCMLLAGDLSRADDMRIAKVDVRKVFDHWNFSIKSKAELKQLREELEKENNERLTAINQRQMSRSKMYHQYMSDKATMSDEDKKKMDDKFRSLGREVKALEQNRRDFLDQGGRKIATEESDTAKLILNRITEAIQAYALEKKYHMVIEMGGHTTRNVPFFVHLEGAEDISDEILARLNGRAIQGQ